MKNRLSWKSDGSYVHQQAGIFYGGEILISVFTNACQSNT
jgi:hypothetical protein